ncbi:hypothetical protein NBRC116494_32620 [Aurantivibrio plasticivorans]
MRFMHLGFYCLVALLTSACTNNNTESTLIDRISVLEKRISSQEDIEAIRRIAYAYGYFMDNGLIPEVIDLFSENTEYCEISGYGLYRERSGCEKIWRDILAPALSNDAGEHRFGVLVKHYLVKDIITIKDSGDLAEARFDYIGFSGFFNVPNRSYNQLGIYRMGFIKEEGRWKINRFNLSFDTSNFNDNDWGVSPSIRCPRQGAPTPDEPHLFYHPFPESGTVPFHFKHPVTNKDIPARVNPQRYWQGNTPEEFGGECGKRSE